VEWASLSFWCGELSTVVLVGAAVEGGVPEHAGCVGFLPRTPQAIPIAITSVANISFRMESPFLLFYSRNPISRGNTAQPLHYPGKPARIGLPQEHTRWRQVE